MPSVPGRGTLSKRDGRRSSSSSGAKLQVGDLDAHGFARRRETMFLHLQLVRWWGAAVPGREADRMHMTVA